VLLLLIIVALAAGSTALLIAASGGLAVGGLAYLWRNYALDRVSHERHFAERRLFPGEDVDLRLSLTNRKLLPVPWVTVVERFSTGLAPAGGQQPPSALRQITVRQAFTLGPFERVSRTVSLRAERRGCYQFGAVEATAGDPFGLFSAAQTLGGKDEVLVYPSLLDGWDYTVRAYHPYGEVKAARPLWEDPTRLAGARDYVAGDQLRRLHWRATARLGRLQSRVYDPGASLQLMLVLDGNTAEHPWHGVDHALLERAISVAATIARDSLERKIPVGLLSNTLTVNSDQYIRVPLGRSPDQLTVILEHMARLIPYFGLPVAPLLERELSRLPLGAALLLVSVLDSADVVMALDVARRRGHAIFRCDPRDTGGAGLDGLAA